MEGEELEGFSNISDHLTAFRCYLNIMLNIHNILECQNAVEFMKIRPHSLVFQIYQPL